MELGQSGISESDGTGFGSDVTGSDRTDIYGLDGAEVVLYFSKILQLILVKASLRMRRSESTYMVVQEMAFSVREATANSFGNCDC